MSISFVITDSTIFREFTVDESSAIRSISVIGNRVTIVYQSNTQQQYVFDGSVRFIPYIRAILDNYNPDEHSMGSIIAKARKSGDLEIVKDF